METALILIIYLLGVIVAGFFAKTTDENLIGKIVISLTSWVIVLLYGITWIAKKL